LNTKHYDYIICGTGCAGLTFFYEIFPYAKLHQKKILLIDKYIKNENDRTWCFWEKHENNFESLITHHWNSLNFKSNTINCNLYTEPYQYKMLQGIHFYSYVLALANDSKYVDIVQDNVLKVYNNDSKAFVETITNTYTATYVFNSIIFDSNIYATPNTLKQHFKGIVIQTQEPSFDDKVATFMDFSVSQHNGTTFMYVLPISATKALVEYTLFTKNLLNAADYDNAITDYIKNVLKIDSFEIIHTEFGVIPMTDYKFPSHNGNIINIGTAAGWVKPSSGFAFKFIEKKCKKIVEQIIANKSPVLKQSFNDKKFHFYDSVLLEVLATNKMNGGDIFAAIFKKNPATRVLRFLDNETNLLEDIKIMASVPMKIFLPVAIRKLVKGN
jgi:lycopene beta-cyclase